jgi:[ribosomal protein S5]-alanine N-acetyltransferase
MIKGRNIFLRHPQIEDHKEFAYLMKESKKLHSGLANPPIEKEKFAAYVKQNESDASESFLICRNQDSAIVGAINLSQIFRKSFQNAYLGYYIGEKFGEKGYMSEAIALILRYAFKDLKLHRIEANIQPHNLASISVVRKNGFTKEGFSPKYLKIGGRWRDHERWAIIRENWQS